MGKTIDLVFNDVEIGCEELGFMPRDERIFTGDDGYDVDDEDQAYRRFLKAKGVEARVLHGKIYL